jgi:hypothetical protein
MKFSKSISRDDGSILLFGIGLAVAALMIVTAAVNVASLWTTRNILDGVADGAALAAAQAIDVNAVYRNGLGSSLTLSDPIARDRVSKYLQVSGVRSQLSGFSVRAVVVSGRAVTVTVQASPIMPFGYLMPISRPVVVSAAKAINKVK